MKKNNINAAKTYTFCMKTDYFFNPDFTIKTKMRIFSYRARAYLKHIWGRHLYGTDIWFRRWQVPVRFYFRYKVLPKIIRKRKTPDRFVYVAFPYCGIRTVNPIPDTSLGQRIKEIGDKIYKLNLHYWDQKDEINRKEREKITEDLYTELREARSKTVKEYHLPKDCSPIHIDRAREQYPCAKIVLWERSELIKKLDSITENTYD